MQRRQKRLAGQRRLPYMRQRQYEALSEVEKQWQMRNQPSERVKLWWNFDGEDDEMQQGSTSWNTRCGPYKTSTTETVVARTVAMTDECGCQWRSMTDEFDTLESWKTPILGKSCSRCGAQLAADRRSKDGRRNQTAVGVGGYPSDARNANERLQDDEILTKGRGTSKCKDDGDYGGCAGEEERVRRS
eukprot:jgi/Phyca11/110909/e_gw1.19.291.1